MITNPHALESPIAQNPPAGTYCAGAKATQIAEGVYANVSDPDNAVTSLIVTFTWKLTLVTGGSDGTGGSGAMNLGDGIFAGSFIVDYAQSHASGGTITITISAKDPAGNSVTAPSFTVQLDICRPTGIIG